MHEFQNFLSTNKPVLTSILPWTYWSSFPLSNTWLSTMYQQHPPAPHPHLTYSLAMAGRTARSHCQMSLGSTTAPTVDKWKVWFQGHLNHFHYRHLGWKVWLYPHLYNLRIWFWFLKRHWRVQTKMMDLNCVGKSLWVRPLIVRAGAQELFCKPVIVPACALS